jgi:hypothetical protein
MRKEEFGFRRDAFRIDIPQPNFEEESLDSKIQGAASNSLNSPIQGWTADLLRDVTRTLFLCTRRIISFQRLHALPNIESSCNATHLQELL